MNESNQRVQTQFAANAAKYETSPVHASGEDLGWVVEAAHLTGRERVLDVGTGTGHTALALAPHAAHVTGLDLTRRMVESAESLAGAQGCTNADFVVSDVAAMPFEDNAFDLVTCRLAAHHFSSPDVAASEIARVLRPGGRFILVDHIAPDNPVLDAFVNRIDFLRDNSHVREWTVPEWADRFGYVGIPLTVARTWSLHLDFQWWIRQAATPADRVAELLHLFSAADAATQAAFDIRYKADVMGEGGRMPLGFALHAVMMVGQKRG